MRNRYEKARQIFHEDGAIELGLETVGWLYQRTIRRVLPTVGRPIYNNVEVVGVKYLYGQTQTDRKLFDRYLPGYFHPGVIRRSTEDGLIEGHKRVTKTGDSVTVIGGGFGVSAVRAARIVGDTGRVVVYEGSDKLTADIEEVFEMNGVEHICDVHHAVVTDDDEHLWGGDAPSGETIVPSELGDCDVLEMDCQGAEFEILQDMEIRPRAIIVELHPGNVDHDEDAFSLLKSTGYEVTHRFDHDGTAISQDTLREMYDYHSRETDYPDPDLRSPPVVVAERQEA